MHPTPPHSTPLLEILHEDSDLLVVNKPPDLVCHPTKGDAYSSLISRARLHLGPDSQPRLVNRLDRETSGVVLLAKNASTAGELGKLLESQAVRKEYLAIVHGRVSQPHAMIDAPLGKDLASQVAIKDCVRPDGSAAQTEFWVQQHLGASPSQFTLLLLVPRTGRKHQIRIHLAHIGHSIVGDKLYGPSEQIYLAFVKNALTPDQRAALLLPNHALHASTLAFSWRDHPWSFTAHPPAHFTNFIADHQRECR